MSRQKPAKWPRRNMRAEMPSLDELMNQLREKARLEGDGRQSVIKQSN
jgi:hypothetical protein